jgi:outer membrane protein OmpA-like peptidoglycan-associated protein/tetratricopeptide (TPR) repeat protein
LTKINSLAAKDLQKYNFSYSGNRINQEKMIRSRSCFRISFLVFLFFLGLSGNSLFSQSTHDCPDYKGKKADKIYDNALKSYLQRDFSEAIRSLNQVIGIEPEYVDAYFVLGLIYIEDSRMNLKTARKHFSRVIELCPGYDVYAYYHLARIAYGASEYADAHRYVTRFLEDVDLIRSDEDYEEAVQLLEYSAFFDEMLSNPVPFDPKPVQGISTPMDEYLPIISPDNDMALFTRKIKIPPRRDDLTPQVRYRERFIFSRRNGPHFEEGDLMPFPFNQHDNEGGATLTIDNKTLYYTLCKYLDNRTYYNCDICYSEFRNGTWTEIQGISDRVNQPDSWESQPTITSDGQTLYFVSDRDGGYGGYDIYKTEKDEHGHWGYPVNMGPKINTSGNEKSPFIHTDSQTLYFSSDGHMGLGGYDIFFTKHNEDGSWSDPENIGYPINSYEDDVGFFVSTDGHYGYFASNKFDGIGGWDLYYFDLYEEARPEKVLFVKGKIEEEDDSGLKETRVELKNTETKEVTSIPVDTITGEYVAAVVFREDHILTVKRKGYVQESNYISQIDPRYSSPAKLTVSLKPVEIGESYRLNDIYFDFNSFELGRESKIVIEEFADFLFDNPSMKVSIEGHTDNIGNEGFNLILSEKRAKSVYDHLISQGISTGQIDYRGFGQSKPIASNATDEGRAMNRRTEFVIIEK